jgi:hypothetical protein
MSKFVVLSRSHGQTAFLRIVDHGRAGVRYGLTPNASDATTFRDKIAASLKAGRAGTIIMRLFEVVEVEPTAQRARTLENA